MNSYINCYRKYFDFKSRASRFEYWMFQLFSFIIMLICLAVDTSILGGTFIFTPIFVLVTFLPSISVAFRRLHDTNRSAWWLLINLVPLIGPIWLFVLLLLPSNPGENRFGPKA